MGDKTGIEWTDATWNPTTGCDRVSPGCDNCYALTQAKRLKAMGSAHYQTDGDPATSGPGFGIAMHADALDKPLRWQRPRRIFVNSMSDLFHSGVTRDFQAQVFAVMAASPRHTFQVLTKRPGVMRARLADPQFRLEVWRAIADLPVQITGYVHEMPPAGWWPLRNVWIGTSVEDQKRADLRIPQLLDTPAAVRFLSMEPLLGPVNLNEVSRTSYSPARSALLEVRDRDTDALLVPNLDWVIVGGESGPGARPMNPDWVRSLLDQCVNAGVPFHFKQWGDWGHAEGEQQPGDLIIQINGGPAYYAMRRVGKKKAGRVLGGRTWDEWPQDA